MPNFSCKGDRKDAGIALRPRAFEIAGSLLGVSWKHLADAFVRAATTKVAAAVSDAISEAKLESPVIVGLGGGAGALIPAAASVSETEWSVPPDAEVISSIGDALSMIRVEVERTLARPSAESVASVHLCRLLGRHR
ncbi:MAG: hypothetical protein GEU71_13885 [Actinobacteria bacterium]|nr:hypothetical protein [Actinomycetota bacterium]